MAKIILVTGATGLQGGSVVRALLRRGGFTVRALTRDVQGPRAKALAEKGVEVMAGDLSDRASLDAALRGAHGVFSIQTVGKKEGDEQRQGIAVAEAAAAAKVEHLVYTSVGGAERKTGIPHFDSKFEIEERIRALGVPHTILRPVFFMENLGTPRVARTIFLGMLYAAMGRQKPLQLIAVEDIGEIAGRAFAEPERFLGQAIELAGDEMPLPQIQEAFRKRTGRPERALPFPRFVLNLMGSTDLVIMIKWFGTHGYAADIPAVRAIHPGLLTLPQWLEKTRIP
ncbi:MAG TPA: NmrA/HSCARG family protein [Myxococcales bacterium]|nr:NmrA/HSCARG family protein [Myxococcales bacterium]